MAKYFLCAVLLVCLVGFLPGCSGEVQVTQAEEEAFRNPPKEIPPESLKAMQEARERGMQKAEEMRNKGAGGN